MSKTHNPYINIATEDYLLKHLSEPVLYFYRNEACVNLPKNAVLEEELNIDNVLNDEVAVVRRMSSGPSVYGDLGTLTYGVIVPKDSEDNVTIEEFLKTIARVFGDEFGLPVTFEAPNNLAIGNKKISGSAQVEFKNNVLYHGAMYFDTKFIALKKYLAKQTFDLLEKGLDSQEQRLTNVVEFFEEGYEPAFIEIKNTFIESIADDEEYEFSADQLEEINKIAVAKEISSKYILDSKGKFNKQNVEYIKNKGTVEVYSNVQDGKIADFEIFCNHLSTDSLVEFSKALIGVEYTEEGLNSFVNSLANYEDFFATLKKEDLVRLIIGK